jgi:hypothetical protein
MGPSGRPHCPGCGRFATFYTYACEDCGTLYDRMADLVVELHIAPRSPQQGHTGGRQRSRPAGLDGPSAATSTTRRGAPWARVEG